MMHVRRTEEFKVIRALGHSVSGKKGKGIPNSTGRPNGDVTAEKATLAFIPSLTFV